VNKALLLRTGAALALPLAASIAAPTAALAQSTGTEATENTEATVVVTGTRNRGVGGVVIPDVPKTRSILTNEILTRQSDGQSVLQSINLVPGVNFTNSDPYGSSGGNLRIRGFPGNRVALLFDGLPLNDTGNYAIFSNQQMDQEIIDQVSVNLGTTDVDSPTPSAAGGVVSYRTILPTNEPSALIKGSLGSFDYGRVFGIVQSGDLTSSGTRAFLAGSLQQYDKFKGPGDLEKKQVNARVYQPLGGNGDFLSISGHFNRNRNNSYNNGLVTDYLADRDFDNIEQCARAVPTAGAVDNDGAATTTDTTVPGLAPSTCTNYYNLRINPSDTGNIRGALKLSLTDKLTLTADPGYQSVLANGGGTATLSETDSRLRGATPLDSPGVDLNGDGDFRDTVRVYQPSNTRTHRYTFLSSLIWEVNDQNRLRVAYTFDRGRHRQTGEFGRVEIDGDPLSVFGGKNSDDASIFTADGTKLQNRDRLSIAMLNQLSLEYFGRFLDNRLTFTAGLRAPWFRRELNQYCFTQVTTGTPRCTSEPIPAGAIIIDPNAPRTGPIPTTGFFTPFERTVKYSPLLPSGGVSFDFTGNHSVYASYGRNFSSPSTDNLYRSVTIEVKPEFTNSYEAGYRYRSGPLQAQLATYFVDYKNRIVTAQDLDPASTTFGSTLDRNVGDARAYGFDGQVSWRPMRDFSILAYGSYIKSRLKEDVLGTATATALATSPCPIGTPVGTTCEIIAVNTKGAQFVETPKWTFGGRVEKDFGPISFGVQGKWVSKRFSTDDNGHTAAVAFADTGNLPVDSRGRTDAYTVIDADVRIGLDEFVPSLKGTNLRFSVINLFDKYYFGNINTQNNLAGGPRFAVGAPRTFQASLAVGF
jgi:iron complex outermembrane receptor protein